MGAKSRINLRNRGIAFKCDTCGRKLMSAQALLAHKRIAHNIVSKRRDKPKPAPKTITAAKKEEAKKAETVTTPPTQSECVKTKENTEMKKNMVEFQCPKCYKRFATYFPALKHIQKHHCINKDNIDVLPNDPSLIQPVRIELCIRCKYKVKSIQTHVCEGPPKRLEDKRWFICVGCEQWYATQKLFDFHVLDLHGDNVESMFFPTNIDFMKWKTDMEKQTRTSYTLHEKYDHKRYYHCNDVQNDCKSNEMYICPSTIAIQEFRKGIQVHYYTDHHEHDCNQYNLSNKYRRFLITSFLKQADSYDSQKHFQPDENDLYLQFKSLMGGIIVDAAKINIATLKIIVEKALEISSIIAHYDEEDEEPPVSVLKLSQNITDEEITEVLNEPLAKRKNSVTKVEPKDVKRPKLDIKQTDPNPEVPSPKILNSFSLANTKHNVNVTKEIVAAKENVTTEIVDDKNTKQQTKPDKIDKVKKLVKNENGYEDTPSSFNDSYREFVVKNFPNTETMKTRSRTKPEIVKTRIGQFTANLSPTKSKPVEEKSKKNHIPSYSAPVEAAKAVQKPKVVEVIKGTTKIKRDYKSPLVVITKEETAKIETKSPRTEIKPPRTETKTPRTEIKPPKTETKTPRTEIKPPRTETKTPRTEIKTSRIETKTQKTETKTPRAETPKLITSKTETKTPRAETPKLKTPNAKIISNSNTPRISFDKPNVDYEYEVKEQEDDCNILILKIL